MAQILVNWLWMAYICICVLYRKSLQKYTVCIVVCIWTKLQEILSCLSAVFLSLESIDSVTEGYMFDVCIYLFCFGCDLGCTFEVILSATDGEAGTYVHSWNTNRPFN